ncbi:MAG: hypothetical protein ACE5GL_08010, partial [Calditrichia bacterium]
MRNRKQKKLKLAIYDFTDCEGCEVKLVSIKEKLLDLEKRFDIVNWRLGQDYFMDGPYDVTIIEGTPVTQDEIDLLIELREKSKLLVALGACASIAGIPGIMDKKDRAEWYKKIYGSDYKPKGIDALPLSAYVKVDHMIHGCPVDEDELVRTLEELLSGKTPHYRGYSVCFECNLAVYYFTGTEDKNCMPGTYLFVNDLLKELKEDDPTGYTKVRFKIWPGVAHSYPPGEPTHCKKFLLAQRRDTYPAQ